MTMFDPPEWSSIAVGQTWTRIYQAGPHQATEAVVFLHGNPGSAADWVDLVEEVGEFSRAVAIELPDFGQTVAAPGFDHTLDSYANFLGDALRTLGINRVRLVLHDFGGPIGLVWAIQNLEMVASVTLIDTGVLPGYRWHRAARAWQTPGVGELVQAITTRAVFRRTISSAEPRGLPREFIDGMYDNYDRRTKAAVLALYRDARKIGRDSELLIMPLAEADLPALVIWGAQDPYLGVEYAERQKEAFPSARVHVLPESGHWPFIDDPAAVSRLLVEFLRTAG
ncbi:MAG TPA: alpha/beta hydrolase [Solirubrobacterales bacterium]|nr:alpha/beta hydrolase [Solirubrobacterales bacterium]